MTLPALGARAAVRRILTAGSPPASVSTSKLAAAGGLFTAMRFAVATGRANAPDGESALGAREVLRNHRRGARHRARWPGRAVDPVPLTPGALNPAPMPTAVERSRRPCTRAQGTHGPRRRVALGTGQVIARTTP
ncbi:hypothetical protein GCM10018966_082160 [Streptomyces yanii]